MPLKFSPISEFFSAKASGIDLRQPINSNIAATIEKAMDRYAVLVWRDQPIDEDQHMALTKWFGPLDMGLLPITKKPNRFKHRGFVDIANINVDNKIMLKDHHSVTSSMANQLWHTDSSFLPTVAKYSLLCACEVPAKGGETEFADLRAAYDELPPELKEIVADLIGEHHPLYSRMLLGNRYSNEQLSNITSAHWPLIRTHPGSGRKVLFVPIHIHKIEGMSMPEARILIHELIEHCTQRKFVYRHEWRVGDLVMWDNRSTLHRGRRFDYTQRRELRRTTTIEGDTSPA